MMGENLHHIAATAVGFLHGFEVAAGDRHVGAKQGHGD
jgi:hypothetical protein